MTKKYFLYARKSSERDERQVQSIDDQINYWKNRLKSESEIEIVKTFTEEKSAKAPGNRPEFKKMIDEMEKGGIEGVLCWKLNRLTRNPVDTGTLQYMLQRGKIAKIVTNEREYLLADSGLLFSVETGMANQFILDLSKDTKRGLKGKADRGWFPGVAPIGYINNLLTKEIDADPERFELVKKMFHLVLSGMYSPAQVVDIANNDWGFRTIRRRKSGGKPLGRTTFYEMLHNVFYTGYFSFKGDMHEGKHAPMISMGDYERIQIILSGGDPELGGIIQRERPKEHSFAYTGNILCGCCGCMITAETKKKKIVSTGETREYLYYHCTHRKDTRDFRCTERSNVTEREMEKQIEGILTSIQIQPEFFEWAKKVLKRKHGEDAKVQEQALASLDTAILTLQNKKTRLTDTFLDQILSEGEYRARKLALEADLANLQIQRQEKTLQKQNLHEIIERTFDFALKAIDRFNHGDLETKKLIFRSIGSNYVLMGGKLSIDLHSYFLPIQKFNSVRSGSLSRLEPTKKSIGMRDTDALSAGNLLWLRLLEDVRTEIIGKQISIFVR